MSEKDTRYTRMAQINFRDVPVATIRKLIRRTDANTLQPAIIFKEHNVPEGIFSDVIHSSQKGGEAHYYQNKLLITLCNLYGIDSHTESRKQARTQELQGRIEGYLDSQSNLLEIWRE